jgi:hypothetical protein
MLGGDRLLIGDLLGSIALMDLKTRIHPFNSFFLTKQIDNYFQERKRS